MGFFDFLISDEVDLTPAMRAAIEPDQSQPDDVQLRAWMGRERRHREDLRDQERSLYEGYSDAPEDEILGLRAHEEAHDRCMTREERRAALACLKGRAPGGVGAAGLKPEACMEAWRDGRAVTGGASSSSNGQSATDGTTGSEAIEGNAGIDLAKGQANVGVKGTVNRGRNHSDTTTIGTGVSTSWSQGKGYMATCNAEADQAEAAALAALRAQRAEIGQAVALRDRFATPWKGAAKP